MEQKMMPQTPSVMERNPVIAIAQQLKDLSKPKLDEFRARLATGDSYADALYKTITSAKFANGGVVKMNEGGEAEHPLNRFHREHSISTQNPLFGSATSGMGKTLISNVYDDLKIKNYPDMMERLGEYRDTLYNKKFEYGINRKASNYLHHYINAIDDVIQKQQPNLQPGPPKTSNVAETELAKMREIVGLKQPSSASKPTVGVQPINAIGGGHGSPFNPQLRLFEKSGGKVVSLAEKRAKMKKRNR
jgi:hypothetical protein